MPMVQWEEGELIAPGTYAFVASKTTQFPRGPHEIELRLSNPDVMGWSGRVVIRVSWEEFLGCEPGDAWYGPLPKRLAPKQLN
jgi:hypothetical protein